MYGKKFINLKYYGDEYDKAIYAYIYGYKNLNGLLGALFPHELSREYFKKLIDEYRNKSEKRTKHLFILIDNDEKKYKFKIKSYETIYIEDLEEYGYSRTYNYKTNIEEELKSINKLLSKKTDYCFHPTFYWFKKNDIVNLYNSINEFIIDKKNFNYPSVEYNIIKDKIKEAFGKDDMFGNDVLQKIISLYINKYIFYNERLLGFNNDSTIGISVSEYGDIKITDHRDQNIEDQIRKKYSEKRYNSMLYEKGIIKYDGIEGVSFTHGDIGNYIGSNTGAYNQRINEKTLDLTKEKDKNDFKIIL